MRQATVILCTSHDPLSLRQATVILCTSHDGFVFVRVCPLQLLVTTESKYLCTDRAARLTEAQPSVPAASDGNLVYVT
jgi:hypothetical protein